MQSFSFAVFILLSGIYFKMSANNETPDRIKKLFSSFLTRESGLTTNDTSKTYVYVFYVISVTKYWYVFEVNDIYMYSSHIFAINLKVTFFISNLCNVLSFEMEV